MSTIHTILVPADFSEYADAAFHLACSLAAEQGARLIVLYVDPPATTHGEVLDRRQHDGYYERLWQELYARQPADSRVDVEYRLRDGEPAQEILELAREESCDLIVMGTHGRSGLRRLLMGSVAEKVLRSAPCPVLTINRALSGAKTQEVKKETACGLKG